MRTNSSEFWDRAGRHLLYFGDEFVDSVPVRAQGTWLYDNDGKRMLDFTPGK